jgi:hypothetical protein
VWIIFTSQSTLILDPKIMLNLELVCNTLNRIFGVPVRSLSSSEALEPGVAKVAKIYVT